MNKNVRRVLEYTGILDDGSKPQLSARAHLDIGVFGLVMAALAALSGQGWSPGVAVAFVLASGANIAIGLYRRRHPRGPSGWTGVAELCVDSELMGLSTRVVATVLAQLPDLGRKDRL